MSRICLSCRWLYVKPWLHIVWVPQKSRVFVAYLKEISFLINTCYLIWNVNKYWIKLDLTLKVAYQYSVFNIELVLLFVLGQVDHFVILFLQL